MPNAAPKPCTVCRVLVHDGTTRCAAHKPKAWLPTQRQVKRTTGRALQRQRQDLFQREPLCRKCSERGHVTLATIRDHIKPLAEGGTDDDENIQPLCTTCHDAKTAAESLRGRGGSNL
jgi:5-methylcytosine-specific restriction protein A